LHIFELGQIFQDLQATIAFDTEFLNSYYKKYRLMKKILVLSCILIIFSCKKQDPQYAFAQENIAEEGLDYDQDSILASIPAVILKPSEIVFEDGETIENFLKRYDLNALNNWGKRVASGNSENKNENTNRTMGVDGYKKFFSDVASAGNRICNDQVHRNPEGIGYAYVYNNNRSFDVKKKAGNCDINLYGNDCSGFVMYMFEAAGVPFGASRLLAADLAQPKIINPYLQKSPLKDYQYDDYKKLPISQIKSGDLIYFKEIIFKKDAKGYPIKPKQIERITDNVGHIGVVAESNGALYIYQSNGSHTKPGCATYSHAVANGTGRGPRCIPVSQFLTIVDWSNYGVLRMVPKKQNNDLIGKWKLTDDKTEVILGKQRFLTRSVNLNNVHISFSDISTFTIAADDRTSPYSCSGHYFLSKENDEITLSDCELYERDPNTPKIEALTNKDLVISFFLMETGFTQVSTLYFEKY